MKGNLKTVLNVGKAWSGVRMVTVMKDISFMGRQRDKAKKNLPAGRSTVGSGKTDSAMVRECINFPMGTSKKDRS
jgi:hypothetical protein